MRPAHPSTPPARWVRALQHAAVLAAGLASAVGLVACGGGGGSSAREPLPPLSTDTVPVGPRIDVSARQYFVGAPGDFWTYTVEQTGAQATRSVAAGPGDDLLLTETLGGDSATETLRRTAEGVVLVAPLADFGLDAGNVVPSLLLYPEPFYPVGGERVSIRQGSLGLDVDGDGRPESFRLEFRQVLVGFETLTLPNGPADDVARFRDVIRLTVQFSDPDVDSVTVVGTEETWWAGGVGLVRAERCIADAAGLLLEPPLTLVVVSGRVGGQDLFQRPPDGTLRDIALVHQDLVHDATRNRYYASVPLGAPAGAGTIATIDAATGAVTHAAALGGSPGALALSADAGHLLVGLDSGALLQLRLPDFAEVWRVQLPADSFFGQLTAERIAVSPADAGTVAVSLQRAGVTPRHGGVVLVRNAVLQPRRTQDHTGSNLVVFGPAGDVVYGFNTETSEYGLRRIALRIDGLEEVAVVPVSPPEFGLASLDLSPQGLLVGRQLRAVPDLGLLGRHDAVGGACRWHAASARVVCLDDFGSTTDRALVVADPTSFAVLGRPVFQPGFSQDVLVALVPGGAGQVALRVGTSGSGVTSDRIRLFTTPALQP